MNPETNPYAPGAGTPPPELAGRDAIPGEARIAIQRNMSGKSARSFMFVGLRGVGKTVLLNEVQAIAEEHGAITDFIEVSTNEPLSKTIVATLRAALLKLDRIKGVSEKVKHALRVLKSFVGAIKVKYEDVEFSVDVDAEPGTADSGTLTRDLAELFVAAGEAARVRNTSIVMLIDEIQNLQAEEFEALIMAIHRTDQKRLPFLVVGAGLPLLVRLTGEAKSYSERLFEYPDIGPLDAAEARRAIVGPASEADVEYTEGAVNAVVEQTKGYPYFLQEWGYQAWNIAEGSPIDRSHIDAASKSAIRRLDQNFFRSRYERLSEPQKAYLMAMAGLGPGPHRTGEIAKAMGKSSSQLGPTRDALINNGMIYSPRYGLAAFTVPLFDEFMKRTQS
ncbi:ATP-binding protein [Nitratireductor sp. XY-223]|uniref:AAA family ATPase n=1 Tax=Nitratireductor sp. XY-223 TaxID=2561926 RepID=UPI0010A9E85B|nr:ATP-binding protein [Nitratireductor sp. XY-223]